MKKRNTFVILIGILLLLCGVGYLTVAYLAEHVLAYSPIRPYRITQKDLQQQFGAIVNPSTAGMDWIEHDITVEDTIHLRGWFVRTKIRPAHGTIFLMHGIGNCRAGMIPVASFLTSAGYNCVMYDSRANGESGGINCTFGYYEKRDLSAYIDSTMTRFLDSGPYAVFGSSLGAAVALQAMAKDQRLVCGIAESPFANLRDVIHDYFARMVHLHINSIPDRGLIYTEQIAHFAIDSVQPALSATQIHQPMMIVHGLQDKNIDPSYGKLVYDKLASKTKVWYPIPNGDHNDLGIIGGNAYRKRIVDFFMRNLRSIQ